MARNKRRKSATARPARHFSTTPLGHTAGRFSEPDLATEEPAFGGFFPTPTVRPLIRTVLVEPAPYQPPPRRGKRQSPTVAVRATFRSTDRSTRSPFLNATMVSPQLTERAILCAKRNIRREVIFATKRTGKGASAPRRKPSKVRC